jgi:leader peptidase (prepilin peptidase)/N-methyltransferase
MLSLVVLLAGATVGSFLNVCIHRLPGRESIVFPASHCPACKKPIRPYDNLPLVSYIVLRGRCRDCGAPISIRYPLVEILTGATALATVNAFGLTPQFLVSFAFLSALIVITFIDLDHQIIPDAISLPGIGVGLLSSLFLDEPGWRSSLVGIVVGGGILWAVAEGYYRLTGREGMGGGDVKLLAMIGAFLGWQAVPLTLLLASLGGTLVGVAVMTVSGQGSRTPIPFGPFLAAGAACSLFFGEDLVSWYLGLTRP